MKPHQRPDRTTIWIVIITVILTVLLVAGISVADKSGVQNNRDSSQLVATETSYDFGTISMAKGKVSWIFKVKNNTSQPIRAVKLFTSCMCTEATAIFSKDNKSFGPFGMPAHGFIPEINEDVAPGDGVDIKIVFDPAAHGPAGVGPIERQVILETSDGQLTFKFKAQVTP